MAVVFVLTGWVANALDSHCGNPERERTEESERVALLFNRLITLCESVHILSGGGNMVGKEARANIPKLTS